MKIAILGYSGSGKSTLARELGARYGVPVLHLDTVQFLPDWQVRGHDEKLALVRDFMDSHDSWVIDGNYTKLLQERRLEEADAIVLLLFNRFSALARVIRRYDRFRGKSRPDMTEGCREKLDAEFVRWVLWKGRSRQTREHFRSIRAQHPDKCVVLKTQRQIDRYMQTIIQNTGKEQNHAGSL